MVLHDLSYLDATATAITFMESIHHKEPQKLITEWRRLAEAYGIELEEDPVLAAQRAADNQRRLEEMFGPAG